jgi:hypothetical protein
VGLIFRQRFKILPGVHLNLSANGMSVSLGAPGATINLSPIRGARIALGIPGTGLSYRSSLNNLINKNSQVPIPPTPHQVSNDKIPAPGYLSNIENRGRDIGSAPIEELALVGNANLQKLIKESYENYEQMAQELRVLEKSTTKAERVSNLMNNFLFRPFFGKKIQNLIEDASNKRNEYMDAKLLFDTYGLKIEWSMDTDIQQIYSDLVCKFEEASKSEIIWDITAEAKTDRFRERTTANKEIARKVVSFTFGRPAYMPAGIDEKWKKVPQINDASGTVIYIFPGFFIFSGSANFALIEPKDINIEYGRSTFIEEDAIPSDAKISGHTWKKANKDGSPDKRFKGNYQIPIVNYGKFKLTSGEIIEEEYMLSKLETTLSFGIALERFCNWFKSHNSEFDNTTKVNTMDHEKPQQLPLKEVHAMDKGKFIEKFYSFREALNTTLKQISTESNVDPTILLFSSFQRIGLSMCGADKQVLLDEVKAINLLGQIFPEIKDISSETWLSSMTGKSDDEWIDITSRGLQKFGAAYLLDIYDQDHGTYYAVTLKQLLFEFALIIANADGEISAEEGAYLEQLRQNIFSTRA